MACHQCHSVAGLHAAWSPLPPAPHAALAQCWWSPNTVEKALLVVGETLEKPNVLADMESVGWAFVKALQAVTETEPYNGVQLYGL